MGAAVGAGSFRRADYLPLIEPHDGEDQAQEQRARDQYEVDQRNGYRDQRQGAARGQSKSRTAKSLAGSEILYHQLGLGGAGTESLKRRHKRACGHTGIYGIPCSRA